MEVTMGTKVKSAITYSETKVQEIANKFNVNPASFTSRMKTGKFSLNELKTIAEVIGADFVCKFVFPDGTEI